MTILLTNLLIQRNQHKFKAGQTYTQTVQTGSLETLGQSYGDNTPQTSGSKSLTIKPSWSRKRHQIPVKITESEREEQSGGGDAVIIPYPELLVKNGRKSMRQNINGFIYGAGSDTGLDMQGLRSALTHDQTYGTITRATTGTNELWQGASIGANFTDQATARSANVANVRKCIDAVARFNNPLPGDLKGITSNENYRSLQSQVGASVNTPAGPVAKYGFRSLFVDDVEIFADPWLSHNSSKSTTNKYFFLLNMPDWRLMLSPKYNFGHMTNFFDQSQIANGLPFELARIKVAGNFVCLAPNQSIFLSNMS